MYICVLIVRFNSRYYLSVCDKKMDYFLKLKKL
jgi:hypothetical protein